MSNNYLHPTSAIHFRKKTNNNDCSAASGFLNRFSIYDNHEDEVSRNSRMSNSVLLPLTPNTPKTPDDVFEELYSKPVKRDFLAFTSVEEDEYDGMMDCNKEWDKVNSILASLEYILEKDDFVGNENRSTSKNEVHNDRNRFTVKQLLEKLNLSKYLSNFISNGFDDTDFLNQVIDNDDFSKIGIKERLDIERILDEVDTLPVMTKIDSKQYNNVNEWLDDLNLNQYSEHFYRKNICTITRLQQLYEIEFITLLNIRLLGHRKRMLCSLGILKRKLNRQNSRSSVKSITGLPPTTYLPPPTVESSTENKFFTTGEKSDANKSNNSSSSVTPTSPSKTSPSAFNRSKSVTFADDKPPLVENSNKIKTKKSIDSSPKKQANYSQYLKDYKSAKSLWKHEPETLMKNGCNYTAQYLGSSALNRLYSNKSPIKYAIDRLKNSAKQSIVPLPAVLLNISTNGVKLLHCETKETLWIHDIKNITSVCQDQEELVYFALITKSDPNSYHYCHVFYCKSAELSNELILTIGQAFDLAFEMFCNETHNKT